MDLKKQSLLSFFLSSFLFFWVGIYFIPQYPLYYFTPFFVVLLYQKPKYLPFTLFFLGLMQDVLSDHALGVLGFSYLFGGIALYKMRYFFFSDELSTLPLLTFFFSCLAGCMQMLLFHFLEKGGIFSFPLLVTDVFLFSFVDVFYVILFFLLPRYIGSKAEKTGKEYFF